MRTSVKLPVKWMSLESLHYGIFSEKTDVVIIILLLIIYDYFIFFYTVVIRCIAVGGI